MAGNMRLQQIRESEKKSHIEIYSNKELFSEGSWLQKPIKTILDLIPLFKNYRVLKVLDLGCGVGRNCICIAQYYKNISCTIDCVDILELAIEKLFLNAKEHGVSSNINGIIQPIEDYPIPDNYYDLIIAVSSLEHIDCEESFVYKLREIHNGIRKNGIVCLVINTNVRETDKLTGTEIPAQFEVNLSKEELQDLLNQIFTNWKIIKSSTQVQQYDIPRENGISALKTNVVTFVARK